MDRARGQGDRWILATALMAAIVALAATARAEGNPPNPTPRVALVPDASLRAIKDRVVRLELDGAPAIEGRLLGFDDTSLTIALATTNQVVSVPRPQLLRMILVDARPRVEVVAPQAAREKLRVLSVQFSVLGTLMVDADYRWLHGFASTSLLLPVLTASGDSFYAAAALGAGGSIPLGETGHWKVDVFAQLLPFHTTSFYTYLGFGLGAGIHYTGASGFSVGFTLPVLGFATRLGASKYGYDPSFTYNDSLGYYYLAAAAGMPLLTMGYRFGTNCPRAR